MKTTLKYLPLILGLLIGSCKKGGYNSSNPTPPSSTVSNAVTKGSWVVSSYTKGTEDNAPNFSGVVFTFSSGGKLTATNNGMETTGTWSYSPSATDYYGNGSSKASFTISLGNGAPFTRLSRKWNIDEASTNDSKLSLVNPEVSENEHVVFSKQ